MSPLAVALLSLALSAPQGASEVARFGIVIGYNGESSADERPPLSFADDDAAKTFLALLPDTERTFLLSTFDKRSARLYGELSDQASPPTTVELSRVLGEVNWLMRQAKAEGKRTELVFYFAGHGDVDDGGAGYLVMADGPLTRAALDTQVVSASSADVNHLIIDACSSYFMVQGRGDGEVKAKLSPAALSALKSKNKSPAWDKTGVFVSTSAAVEVHESAALSGGVFSYLFRSAISGAADVDGDGRVGYTETAAFVASASSGMKDERARLEVFARAPRQRPHAVLKDINQTRATHFLALSGDDDVRLSILDASGRPHLELNRAKGAPALIELSGHPFFIVQRGDEEAVLVPRSSGAYALSSLRFQKSPRARSGSSGPFAGLYTLAYSAEFLGGFTQASEMLPPKSAAPVVFRFAEGAQPPFEFPWLGAATGSFAAAAALGVVAGGLATASLVSFSELEADFRDNNVIDPEKALQVEALRTSTTVAAMAALALGITAAGFFGGYMLEETQ